MILLSECLYCKFAASQVQVLFCLFLNSKISVTAVPNGATEIRKNASYLKSIK